MRTTASDRESDSVFVEKSEDYLIPTVPRGNAARAAPAVRLSLTSLRLTYGRRSPSWVVLSTKQRRTEHCYRLPAT